MKAAIIQARMGSTRLPGKVLADVAGKPMLHRVVERVQAATLLDRVIVATTTHPSDALVAALVGNLGVGLFRGSTEDVLDRYYHAAHAFDADVVVRVTADCPLVDPHLVDRAVAAFEEGGWDYVSTAYPVATYPDGLDVEVFSIAALDRAWREAFLPSQREHVTSYIWNNPGLFRLRTITSRENLSAMRWTVDEERDLRFVREVYRRLGGRAGAVFGMEDVLGLLERHLEILEINHGIERNGGYRKSLEVDGRIAWNPHHGD